jgi:protein involved in polysaccharide export with SLBB domain
MEGTTMTSTTSSHLEVHLQRLLVLLTFCAGVCTSTGCYTPLQSHGIWACSLPDSFRTPVRSVGPPLNYSHLTVRPTADYILGGGDVLEVTIPELYPGAEAHPLRVQVMGNGQIHLPSAGAIAVGGMNLMMAQEEITRVYKDGIFKNPRVNVGLLQKATIDVLVLGEVKNPGVLPLPKYQNDVGHALASAGGLTELAADAIEVHRRVSPGAMGEVIERPWLEEYEDNPEDPRKILRIPLRGLPPGSINEQDVLLEHGDVVVVPNRKHEVFFVVGQLNQTNLLRFSVGERDRELGTGLVLPRDQDIDVVTAVVMAGYIDPIDSPTTVTVHRIMPDGEPMLIKVDLIRARYNRSETILVEAGDIIYVNPDAQWWIRRTLDRVIPALITAPYGDWMNRMILGPRRQGTL